MEKLNAFSLEVSNYIQLHTCRNEAELVSRLEVFFSEVAAHCIAKLKSDDPPTATNLWICIDRESEVVFDETSRFVHSGLDLKFEYCRSNDELESVYITIGLKMLKSEKFRRDNEPSFRQWLLQHSVESLKKACAIEESGKAALLISRCRFWLSNETSVQFSVDSTGKLISLQETLPRPEMLFIYSPGPDVYR